MKRVYLAIIAIMLVIFDTFAVNYDYKVVNTDNCKDIIWKNLHSWIADNFTSSSVIDYENLENGEMTIKFSVTFDSPISRFLAYKCDLGYRIEVKDGKFRYMPFAPIITVTENPNLDTRYMSYGQIQQGIADLELILNTAQEYNLGENWIINSENFLKAVENSKNKRDSIKKYKNEKDERKDKPTPEWRTANHEYEILFSIQHCCDGGIETQSKSLESSLTAPVENW